MAGAAQSRTKMNIIVCSLFILTSPCFFSGLLPALLKKGKQQLGAGLFLL
jgi:hypothetical protein